MESQSRTGNRWAARGLSPETRSRSHEEFTVGLRCVVLRRWRVLSTASRYLAGLASHAGHSLRWLSLRRLLARAAAATATTTAAAAASAAAARGTHAARTARRATVRRTSHVPRFSRVAARGLARRRTAQSA